MLILIFDTETTGLPTERNPSINDLHKWPHIIQISWVIYDDVQKCVVDEYDKIIAIPADVTLTEGAVQVHGITRERSVKEGIHIRVALFDFKTALNRCGMIVGHNLSFDKRLIMVEGKRQGIYMGVNMLEYCTMKNGINLCRIPKTVTYGTDEFKYPRLIELYTFLYGDSAVIPDNLHNSKVDVDICLQCFVRMQELGIGGSSMGNNNA
jgi:DNA polymerase III epsilon subunit-like protein